MSTAGAVLNDFTNTPSGGPNNQLVLGPDGNFWFTEMLAQKVAKVSLTGALTEYSLPASPEPSGPQPAGIAVAGGQLWFTANEAQGIDSITTSGTQKQYTLPVPVYPYALAYGSDGNLWYGSCNGTISRIAIPSGSTLAPTIFTVDQPARIRGIAPGPNADMWGANTGGSLVRVPLTATDESQMTSVAVSEMAQWLTVGPDKAIWFTEASTTGTGKIGRLVP